MPAKPTAIRRTVAVTGLCLTGLMLAACQSAATTTASGSSTPTTGDTITGKPTGAATSLTGTTGPGPGSSADSCSSGQLKASTAYNSAFNSGSTLIAFVILTNTSAATCTIDGYAGVDFLDPSGHSLGMSTTRIAGSEANPEHTQTLAPGKTASEEFTFTFAANDQGNGCVNAETIAVIPPNQTKALDTQLTSVKTGTIPVFGVCTTTITVFPFGPADQIPS
jgi:hypothetical protein